MSLQFYVKYFGLRLLAGVKHANYSVIFRVSSVSLLKYWDYNEKFCINLEYMFVCILFKISSYLGLNASYCTAVYLYTSFCNVFPLLHVAHEGIHTRVMFSVCIY